MTLDMASFLLGAMCGGSVVAIATFPRAGRIFAKTVSAILMLLGIGFLTWAITAMIRGTDLTPLVWKSISITQYGELLGIGGGLLGGSILALVLSFVGRSDLPPE